MDNSVDIKAIVDRMEAFCLNYENPKVLGTDIGMEFKAVESLQGLKDLFGGLKGFILANCSNLRLVGRSGMDNVYAHAKRLSEAVSDSGPANDARRNPWRAFSNPLSVETVYLDPQGMKLVLTESDDSVPEGWKRVPKVSEDDYRKMAREFVLEVFPSKMDEFEKVISGESFWFPFVNKVREAGGKAAYSHLLSRRLQRLNELFQERLVSLGISPEEAEKLRSYVREFKYKQLEAKMPFPQRRGVEYSPSTPGTYSLRKIIHACIDMMTDDQLRQILIPAGVMLDAIGIRRQR